MAGLALVISFATGAAACPTARSSLVFDAARAGRYRQAVTLLTDAKAAGEAVQGIAEIPGSVAAELKETALGRQARLRDEAEVARGKRDAAKARVRR